MESGLKRISNNTSSLDYRQQSSYTSKEIKMKLLVLLTGIVAGKEMEVQVEYEAVDVIRKLKGE